MAWIDERSWVNDPRNPHYQNWLLKQKHPNLEWIELGPHVYVPDPSTLNKKKKPVYHPSLAEILWKNIKDVWKWIKKAINNIYANKTKNSKR
jgi:hypothetical protein